MGVFDDVSTTWRNLDYFGSEGAMINQYRSKLKERELNMLHKKLTPRHSVDSIMSADSDTRRVMLDELDEQVISLNEEGHLLRLNKEMFSDVFFEAGAARRELYDNAEDNGLLWNYSIGLLAGGLTSVAWNVRHLGSAPTNTLIQDFPPLVLGHFISKIPTLPTRLAGGIIILGGLTALSVMDSTRQSNLATKQLNYYNDIVGFPAMELADPYEGMVEGAVIGGVLSLPIVAGVRLGAKGLLRGAKKGVDTSYGFLKQKLSTEKFVSSVMKETRFDKVFDKVINSPDATVRNEGYRRIMESNRALEQAIKARDLKEMAQLHNSRLSQLAAVTDETSPGKFRNDAKTLTRIREFVKESKYDVVKRDVFINPTKEILSTTKTLVKGSFNVAKRVIDEGEPKGESTRSVSTRGKIKESGAKQEIEGRGLDPAAAKEAAVKWLEDQGKGTKPKEGGSGVDVGGELAPERRKRVFSYDNDKYDYLTAFGEETGSINKKVLRFTESRFNHTKEFKDTPDDKKATYLRDQATKAVKDIYYDWKDIDLTVKNRKEKLKNTEKFNSNMYNKLFLSPLSMDGFNNKHLQAIPEFLQADFLENHFYPAEGVVGDTLVSALKLGLPKVKFTWPEAISQYEISHLKNPDHVDAARLYNRAVNHHKIVDIVSSLGDSTGLKSYTESYSDAGANIRSVMNSYIADMSEKLSDYRYKDKRFGEMILDKDTSNDILRGMAGDKDISDVAKSVVNIFSKLEKFTMETYSDLGYGKDQLTDFFISSYDRLILEKYGTKGDFIDTLAKHMDVKRTLGIAENHPAAPGRAKAFATEMYNGILSRDTQVYDVASTVDASRKKYFPKNGASYVDILDKFGAQKSALDLIGTYVDKHSNTLARIQLYGDPFQKGYFIEHVQQFTEATPRIVDSVFSTLDFIYSGAFPSHETFFTTTLGWMSSIKNASNLLGSSLTAFFLDKAPMALAIADATKQPFLGVRNALIQSFNPFFYKNKANFNKAMMYSENIARHTVGLMQDNVHKLKRTKFDEFMSKINGLRAITQANFFITEYTITHGWHEMGIKNLAETQPKAFGITLGDWERFMTSPEAITQINGVGIRHPRQLMVRGITTADREAGRKIGHYLARTVNSGVLNSLDTKTRKTLTKGSNLIDSPIVKMFSNQWFVYASAPLQIVSRIYPMMLRMADRSKYGELAAIVLMGTALSYTRDLIKDLSNGRVPDENLKAGLLKAFLNNDLVLGHYGQAISYMLFEGNKADWTANTPLLEAVKDVYELTADVVSAPFTEEDPEKQEKVLADIRKILDRDVTFKRFPIIGAYAHRQLMDAIFSGADPNYEESIIKRQEMYRKDGYEYWWGEE